MRKTAVFYVFAGLAAGGAALALQLLMRRTFPVPSEHDIAQAVRPSYLARTSAAGTIYDTDYRRPSERAPAGGLGPPHDEAEAARWRGYIELNQSSKESGPQESAEDERDRHFRGKVRILNQEKSDLDSEREEAERYHRSPCPRPRCPRSRRAGSARTRRAGSAEPSSTAATVRGDLE
jgi:hypothetical protein